VGTRIGVSRRDSSGLRGGIMVSKRDLSGLRRGNNGSQCRLRGGIEGFGRVVAIARLLRGILGFNCCKAFRFLLYFSFAAQHLIQLANTLLFGPVEGSLRKEEIRCFW
jgi:hypothetical protein